SNISINNDDYIFEGLPERIDVGRYHSWVVDKDSLPDCLEVTAVSDDGEIMAMRHKTYDIRGVQFHPESILTPTGIKMIENWLKH
ncbi:MAG: gamma-glutamyl-gamma-aminobutyrate hydrolase family protein, partial [Muribaculaceae bacterium]|nr:gamma-glutamyl-gamma-aminobutyrate hydrolase family protein [Muribaculaceae bacterium]